MGQSHQLDPGQTNRALAHEGETVGIRLGDFGDGVAQAIGDGVDPSDAGGISSEAWFLKVVAEDVDEGTPGLNMPARNLPIVVDEIGPTRNVVQKQRWWRGTIPIRIGAGCQVSLSRNGRRG